MKEEQFGPALPILKYGPNSPEHKSLDDVIAAANNTHYGLGSSVWGADNEKAQEVAAKMEAGTAWINSEGSWFEPSRPQPPVNLNETSMARWTSMPRAKPRWTPIARANPR